MLNESELINISDELLNLEKEIINKDNILVKIEFIEPIDVTIYKITTSVMFHVSGFVGFGYKFNNTINLMKELFNNILNNNNNIN